MTVSSNDILLERFGAMSLATSTIRHTIRIRSVSVVQQDSDFTSVACREGGEGGCCQGGEARFSAKRALTFRVRRDLRSFTCEEYGNPKARLSRWRNMQRVERDILGHYF